MMQQQDQPSHASSHALHALWPMKVYVPAVGLFMLCAALLYGPMPELAFRSDNSPVSWLSSAQLWALAVVSLRLSVERALPLPLGLWLTLAMMLMAFDEQFMFHEQWKYGCPELFSWCRWTWVRELPMLMVGAGGLVTALWLHLTVRHRWARTQLWSAIGIGLFALSMDLWHITTELTPYEEGFEVLSEALFMAFLLGLPAFKATKTT